MTDIGVFSQPFQTEDRSWLLSEFDDLFTLGGTLLLSAFTLATHYPNGFIPSGTAVGLVTAQSTGGALVLGPYDSTAADGRQSGLGLTVSSVRVLTPIGGLLTKVGVGVGVAFGAVSLARLPFNSGNAAVGRGYVDAAFQTTLKNLYFAA